MEIITTVVAFTIAVMVRANIVVDLFSDLLTSCNHLKDQVHFNLIYKILDKQLEKTSHIIEFILQQCFFGFFRNSNSRETAVPLRLKQKQENRSKNWVQL
jgi:hypothetical protein